MRSFEILEDLSVDKIFITSVRYQDEIRCKLKEYGFSDGQIETLDRLIFYLFEHAKLIEQNIRGIGLEIGGPSDVFSHIYDVCTGCDGINFCTDTIWWKQTDEDKYAYGDHTLGKMYITDATNLADLQSGYYDFVISSNNLEHIANPLKAMGEFYRVVKKSGVIIVVVPRKFVNFDHNRQFTTFRHILGDYENNITEDDLSHLPEIIEKHDFGMDPACGGKDKFIQRASQNFENRCLHHHVFDKECLISMFEYYNLKILEYAETYSDYWIIGEK